MIRNSCSVQKQIVRVDDKFPRNRDKCNEVKALKVMKPILNIVLSKNNGRGLMKTRNQSSEAHPIHIDNLCNQSSKSKGKKDQNFHEVIEEAEDESDENDGHHRSSFFCAICNESLASSTFSSNCDQCNCFLESKIIREITPSGSVSKLRNGLLKDEQLPTISEPSLDFQANDFSDTSDSSELQKNVEQEIMKLLRFNTRRYST